MDEQPDEVPDDWNAAILLRPFVGLIQAAQFGELTSGMLDRGLDHIQLSREAASSDPDWTVQKAAHDIEAICAEPLRYQMRMWQGVVRSRLTTLQQIHEALSGKGVAL